MPPRSPKNLTTGIIYIPLDVRWPRTKKVRALIVRHGRDGMAAWVLYLAMACYCRENLSDGFVPADEIGALAYPLPPEQTAPLVALLLDYRLIADSPGHPSGHSQGHSPGHSPGDGPGHSQGHSGGYVVRAYVKRNGTRGETLDRAAQLAEWGRRGAANRWSDDQDGRGHSPGYGPGYGPGNGQTETETKTETSASARAPARAREPSDAAAKTDDDDDLDELTNVAHALLVAHGPIARDQTAAWVRALLDGKLVDDRRRYVVGAIRRDPGKVYREATSAVTPAASARRQPPPSSRICHRCSKTGHRPEDCPTLATGSAPDDRERVAAVGGPQHARELLKPAADAMRHTPDDAAAEDDGPPNPDDYPY